LEGLIFDFNNESLGSKFEAHYVGIGFGIFHFSCKGAYVFSLDFFLNEVCSVRFAELNVF